MNLIETITAHAKEIAALRELRGEDEKREKSPHYKPHDTKESPQRRYCVTANGGAVCWAASWEEARALAEAMNSADRRRFRVAADAIEAKLRAAITTSMIGEAPL